MSGTSDLEARLTDWARKMGYSGNIPKDLNLIITPKSAHVWEQVLVKIQPKKHCRQVRDNILVNRLKNEHEITPFNYPIDEIELYKKREKLNVQLSAIKSRISDNEAKIQNLSDETKLQGQTLIGLQTKIKEHERFALLLNAKSESLQKEIVEVEEMIAMAKRLTPVELSDDVDRAQIQDDLKKCVAKLETIVSMKKKQKERDKSTATSLDGQLSADSFLSIAETSFPDMSSINEIDDHHQLDDSIKNVMYKHDRLSIMLNLQDNFERSIVELTCYNFLDGPSKGGEKKFLFNELYAVHVKNELEARLLETEIKQLNDEVNKRLQSVIDCGKTSKEHRSHLLLQLQEAKANAAEAYIKKQIALLQKSSGDIKTESDLKCAQAKSDEVQQQIVSSQVSIKGTMGEIKEHHQRILDAHENVRNTMRKLQSVQLRDLSWCNTLVSYLFQKEIQLFRAYPLNLNPISRELDESDSYSLLSIIGNPYAPPETTFFDLMHDKINLRHRQSLLYQNKQQKIERKYSLSDLAEKEDYAGPGVEKLRDLCYRAMQKNVTTVDGMDRIVKLWVEMPFRHFVSPGRLLEGHNYQYYDKVFNGYLNML